MLTLRLNLAATALALMLHTAAPAQGDLVSLSEQVREIIRNRVETSRTPQNIVCKGELICDLDILPRFYEARLFSPAWSDHNGPLPFARHFIEEVEEAEKHGLRGADYHLGAIASLLEEPRAVNGGEGLLDAADLADLDLLLTDAFLIYASHLLSGRVDPGRIRAEWNVTGRKADLGVLLHSVIASGQIRETLAALSPPHPGYARLRQALSAYRSLPGRSGWQKIPDHGKMQIGDAGSRVAALRNRLATLGDMDSNKHDGGDLFDEEVENGVKRFQKRHGLVPDGIVGRMTFSQLNVHPEERIRQIEVNMERWRWLPETMGDRYIFVNIANFELGAVEGFNRVMTMRAIVGRHYQRTPVFSSQMLYLVLNPYWNIPMSIAAREMVPSIRKDPGYLKKHNIKVFSLQGSRKTEVDPATIDWTNVSSENFDYFFRQEPGPMNALGRIKFMFPNRFNVYLHDTPHKELFERPVRQFSHGCIRIEKPLELAEYLLGGQQGWTRENLLRALDGSLDKAVRLPQPIGIHVLYWTAWVDADGTMQFRNDVYGRDKLLARALAEKPPGP